ncbi:uncharacterized protein LOC134752375 isoform X3 [Cydia strobilella]|uniref:uncharacterized protein LOC134752375 isoform X3 n=1 Tax=Cydia strobilella TaxID=1100964 RepID=UPI00300500C8
MALVLRNAALQKQVSLLKCIKTRTVVTTANKNNNQAPLSAACELEKVPNSMPNANAGSGFQPSFYKLKPSVTITALPKRGNHTTVIVCKSCAAIPDRRKNKNNWLKARSMSNLLPRRRYEDSPPEPEKSRSDVSPALGLMNTMFACPCGPCGPCGPCCGPCGPCCGNMSDCNCGRMLPPPCNTPPKCIQYMQGYYYYPYGTWFCGPYHVSTGGVPCPGPVCPGTSCGIAPPNPNLLCGKCGPCCGPCGPCCCGLLECSLCNPPKSWGMKSDNSQSNSNQGSCAWFGGLQSNFCMPYAADASTKTSWSNTPKASEWLINDAPAESVDSQKNSVKSTNSKGWDNVRSRGISSDVAKRYPFKNTARGKPEITKLTT